MILYSTVMPARACPWHNCSLLRINRLINKRIQTLVIGILTIYRNETIKNHEKAKGYLKFANQFEELKSFA